MKRNIKFLAALAVGCCLAVTSCSDKFGDDLRSLGSRVEILESRVLEMNTSIEYLQQLLLTIQSNGYATDVVKNSDGTYTVTFNNGETVTLRDGRIGFDGLDGRDGTDGRDGIEAELIIGVWQDIDGRTVRTVMTALCRRCASAMPASGRFPSTAVPHGPVLACLPMARTDSRAALTSSAL